MKTTICFGVVKTTVSCENNWLFFGAVQARAGPDLKVKGNERKYNKLNMYL